MKIIPKIVLYITIILFLSISLDEKAGSQITPKDQSPMLNKSRAKVRAAPYGISNKIKIENPVYKEKIALSSNLEPDH